MAVDRSSGARMLAPHWPTEAEWFVVGGTANDNEAQYVHDRWPGRLRFLGVDANPDFCEMQRTGRGLDGTDEHFPGTVVHAALWSAPTELTMSIPADPVRRNADGGLVLFPPNRGSVCREPDAPDTGPFLDGKTWKVPAVTLDQLSQEHGPMNNVVLWLDVEYAELAALQGAHHLLDRTLLVNVETYAHLNLSKVVRLLRGHGLWLADVWNVGPTAGKDAQDYIFVRKR